MLVQGSTSNLISNYHHLTKNIITFFHQCFYIFQRKINIFEDFNHHQMVSFDHHFPPSLVICLNTITFSLTLLRDLLSFENWRGGEGKTNSWWGHCPLSPSGYGPEFIYAKSQKIFSHIF